MKEIMNVCHSAQNFWNSYSVFPSSVIELHNDIPASFMSTILNANVSQLMPNISEHRGLYGGSVIYVIDGIVGLFNDGGDSFPTFFYSPLILPGCNIGISPLKT